jgi:transposase-like protein
MQAGAQVVDLSLQCRDLCQLLLKLQLQIADDLDERTHDHLHAHRRLWPIVVGNAQARWQIVHNGKYARPRLICQLNTIHDGTWIGALSHLFSTRRFHMPTQRRFTAKFKTQVVLDLITEAKTMAQICREHNLKDQVVRRWKSEFLEHAETIFGGDATSQQHLERLAELERLVGRLTMELEIAKKASQLSISRLSRNDR